MTLAWRLASRSALTISRMKSLPGPSAGAVFLLFIRHDPVDGYPPARRLCAKFVCKRQARGIELIDRGERNHAECWQLPPNVIHRRAIASGPNAFSVRHD